MKRVTNLISSLLMLLSIGANFALADSLPKVKDDKSIERTSYRAETDAQKLELKQVTQIAKAFANSHILGTGSSQYLTRVRNITGGTATVFLGESDPDGEGSEAYKVNFEKINGKWKVVTYEFGKIGVTGDVKQVVHRLGIGSPLYPSLESDQMVEDNGGVAYYKQYPNELDRNELPIVPLQPGRFITVEIINKHKTDGVEIGPIYYGNQAETLLTVYGRTENDISEYLQNISSELRLVRVYDVRSLEACGKSIVRGKLSIIAKQDELSVPHKQSVTKISFNIDGEKFDCDIEH